MLRPTVRSLLSAVLTASFALSVMAWGTMPECPARAPGGAAHGSDPHHASPLHPDGHHGRAPANQACVVHLCCAHVVPQPRATLGRGRLSATQRDLGFAPRPALVTPRPAYSLPFAQAPPRSVV